MHRRLLVRAILDSQNANLFVLEFDCVVLGINLDGVLGGAGGRLRTHGLLLLKRDGYSNTCAYQTDAVLLAGELTVSFAKTSSDGAAAMEWWPFVRGQVGECRYARMAQNISAHHRCAD
jgi:hypothetical protein